MSELFFCALPHRALLRISGKDSAPFLQNLISNDIHKAKEKQAIYALLLTPQGKFLFDFLIVKQEDSYLLDCEAARLDELMAKLTMYRLRAQVHLEQVPDLKIWFISGSSTIASREEKNIWRDPRHAEFGWRCFSPSAPLSGAQI